VLRPVAARRERRREGGLPEWIGGPRGALRAALAAEVAWRASDVEAAARHAAEVETVRPRAAGTLGQQGSARPFDDFRDVDDCHAGFFEVLTTTGKYFWIATERVLSIEFHAPRRPRDLAWRRATMSVADGPDGEVYLPAIYDADDPNLADEFRLGRATDWAGDESGPVRGIGGRVVLVGDEALGIMELGMVRFGS